MGQNFSKLGIVNKGLYKIGAKRIDDLDDSDNPIVVYVNDIYDQCRQELLEEHTWSFATQTVGMTQLTLATALPIMNDGVTNAYGLPADFINPYMFSCPCIYRKEMLKSPYVTQPVLALLSDINNIAAMKYIFDNDDPTTYSAKFYDAFSCKIARELCFKISEAATYAATMESSYQRALMSAIGADSNTSSPDESIADEWFAARLAGSGQNNVLPNGNIGFTF